MTVLLFLLAAFWQAVLTAAGPVQSASDRQNRELAVVALGSLAVRAAIPDSAETLSEPVTTSFAVPMFASFLPIISYSTLVFVVAFVAAQFRKWFKLRNRGPHHLEDDDESNVELLPTSIANVLPEFRDFAVPLPNVPSPPQRIGRPIESRVERLKSGRVHGRSVSLSHPSAVSQATLLPDLFPSSPHHFHSTPNTPSPLIDLSIPDGIHTRKPFVNELTSDINISSDTLFGVHRSLSNRSQDIADIYLKMKSTAPEPVPSSPTESHSSEQDITLVQTETDLIDFSPKQRALQLEARFISEESKLVDSPVEDVVELVVEQVKKPAEPEMQLLDFSQWDEEGWGFEVVTPSVANEELDHSDDEHPVVYPLDAATASPWETKEQPTLEDPFASPPAEHAVLEAVESGAPGENAIEASPSREGLENPFASPVGRRVSLDEDAAPPEELLSSSSGSSDTLGAVELVTVPEAAVEHDDSSYDSSTDSSPSQIQPVVADYERLETPSPRPSVKDVLLPTNRRMTAVKNCSYLLPILRATTRTPRAFLPPVLLALTWQPRPRCLMCCAMLSWTWIAVFMRPTKLFKSNLILLRLRNIQHCRPPLWRRLPCL
ncbi:hypothetical protein BDZ89DRAFT_442943 [Hymenopellis radicata]|nr:hypothetical protein BDZ89DRAFT_442943 [Hymenopellis radicata]